MEEMIRIIVMQKGRTRAASFYLSILIAYLELHNWQAAYQTMNLLEHMVLHENESKALAYLSILWEYQDQNKIEMLADYLGDC